MGGAPPGGVWGSPHALGAGEGPLPPIQGVAEMRDKLWLIRILRR